MAVSARDGVKGRPASATSPEAETTRLRQALADLSACEASSVSLVHCPSRAQERALVRALAAEAGERGFVTAQVSLRESGLESPDALVRAVLEGLTAPGDDDGRGLLYLLELFYDQHGTDSAERFYEAAAAADVGGSDLAILCRAYLATDDPEAVPEVRAYSAWLGGVEPPRKYKNRLVRRALSERTAQRTLGDLSRILGALDHHGLLLLLSEGDGLASRTERQREKAYTVLRELVDNFDGAGGAVATRLILTGRDALFEGAHSIQSVVPLRMRLEIPSAAEPPPPHRSWTTLTKDECGAPTRRKVATIERAGALRNLIRISEGLPPVDKVIKMSVGQERLDRTIRRLFDVVNRSGSFFSVLVGEYGSGKTHLMMHLAERALEDSRPVFWLNLERTNLDLGNPARHLSRFLEHSTLPMRGKPRAIDLAARWTRSTSALSSLSASLTEIAAGEGEAAAGAKKALRIAAGAADPGFALENYLTGADLESRPGHPAARRDAYRRIFLWFELLARIEQIRGPVILIDEAENLYTSGRPPASRRTSLRSLSFYCGGALPGACVILAMTPPAFEEMKAEARDLLAEADEMDSTLELERVDKFRRSLWRLKPDPVKPLTRAEREELCERVRKMHRSVRGAVDVDGWSEQVKRSATTHDSPRMLIRSLIDELEATWWKSGAR